MIVTIDRLGHLGDGIAQSPQGPIYAPQTLPGEVVEGTVEGSALLSPRILTPSADRVRAPCAHYRTCGGCSLQHASDAFVADWKIGVVRTALAAQGLAADFRPIVTSAPRTRRRATLAGRRTKKGAMVGFHARASDTLVEVTDCHLLHPALMAALPVLREITLIGASRSAEIALTITHAAAGLDLAVSGAKPADATLRMELARLAAAHRIARLTWDGEGLALITPPAQPFGPALVTPPPGAFLQATLSGESALLSALSQAVLPARHIADLFAGCGTFTLPLAQHAEVHAVEAEAPMLDALAHGWRNTPGLKRITTEPRDLFRRPLHQMDLKPFDAVVIDPPRAGAEAQMHELAHSPIPRIAAISCNPVTFARDAKILTDGGYRLHWVQVVDQFRWSPHIELAAAFTKQ